MGLVLTLTAAAPQGDLPPPMPDGRMLGHLPYAEALRSDLVEAPAGFGVGQPCFIHRDAAPDLARLLTAAALTPGVGRTLHAVSCFRAIAHQRAVFCRNARPGICPDPFTRARFVGPPGYSEHATGYAIDFAVRPAIDCRDVDACIAATNAGRWLLAHAPDYGFELSFPNGNPQGVTWEPWHWRWVGTNVNVAGAARARLTFARARATYPGKPRITGDSDAWLIATAPPPPLLLVTKTATALPPPLLGTMAAPWSQDVRR
ncbi:MAG: M15 family metallopeptidase [Pseudomonadota bacterium]|jgi:D-alanyl-D-alanine carboxypeptidase